MVSRRIHGCRRLWGQHLLRPRTGRLRRHRRLDRAPLGRDLRQPPWAAGFLLYCPDMTRLQRLNRNPRLLFWTKVCINFKTLNAIITLFYLHRGLSIAQIVWLSGLFGAVSLFAEIPSGYMADHLGRKRTMLLGVAFMLASTAIHWFATDFFWFAVSFVFLSFSFSCFSGTEEALLYDTLKETGHEKKMLRFNSRLLSAQNLAKIFLPSVGAIIAMDL